MTVADEMSGDSTPEMTSGLTVEPLTLAVDGAVTTALPRIAYALAGGAPVRPIPPGGPPPQDPSANPPTGSPTDLPADLAAVIGTSGSTGAAKLALLTTGNLRASAEATATVLGGPGRWLLALPPWHIAGFQVLVRSVLAGTVPVAMDRAGSFDAAAFAAAASAMGPGRRYTSLVPAQLTRLLDHEPGRRAAATFDAVLVGGAALAPALRERAQAAGIPVVATYGMSESAGGCVYDGTPLPGVQARVDPDGRIRLGGPVVAAGYLGDPARTREAFGEEGGTRWFRTDDLGALDGDGRLRVLGRADDVINTGGVKVSAAVVEAAVVAAGLCPPDRFVVIGMPDAHLGEAVTLVAERGAGIPELEAVREALRERTIREALPRRLELLEALPRTAIGKPDRPALRRQLGV